MAKYKLIIIDDEVLVIKGLSETVDWAALDVEIVATCLDGQKGLDAIHLLKPDLVISDIRMPYCDGLSLAKKLAGENFDCAFIIYSGYSDFDYVSRALEYGVMRYLLKPIENGVLVEKVKEVLEELERKRFNRHAAENYKMSLPLLKDNLVEKLLSGDKSVKKQLEEINVKVPKKGIVIDSAVISGDSGDKGYFAMYQALCESLDAFGVLGVFKEDKFTLITGLEDADVIYGRIKRLTDDKAAYRISVGISSPYGDEQTLLQAYAQARTLRERILFPVINSIAMADTPGSGGARVVREAVKIIAEDYGKKLSVKDVADRLYVSESHLMHEFKENTGKTFNECLTEYRMIKAQELLKEGKLRIKEVAAAVGYADVKYFGQIFKEYTNMTPAEYCDKAGKK